ncbi:MAG: hypothetical protein ACOVOV_01585 [Dolichospermum sp.]
MKHHELTTTTVGNSLFDSIRHFDEQGQEFWTGRELMRMMGYAKWQRFESAIAEAVENLEYEGDSVEENFLPLVVKSGGRQSLDYKMSRYACYMTALCCDNRKPEVKSAKKYFAVQARKAEVMVPAQSEKIRELELQVELAKTHRYLVDRSEAIATLHGAETLALILGKSDAVVTQVEKHFEAVVTDSRSGRSVSFEGMSLAQLAKRLNFKSGTELKGWLRKVGREDLIAQGMRAVQSEYVPSEYVEEVKALYRQRFRTGERQMLLGEA